MSSRFLRASFLSLLRLAACQRSPGEPASVSSTPVPASVSVTTTHPVIWTTINQTVTATGNVVAMSEVNVLTEQSGRIDKLAVNVGSTVKERDVIAQIAAAQTKLVTIKAGPRPETVAQAELPESTAQTKLPAMKNGHARTRSHKSRQILSRRRSGCRR